MNKENKEETGSKLHTLLNLIRIHLHITLQLLLIPVTDTSWYYVGLHCQRFHGGSNYLHDCVGDHGESFGIDKASGRVSDAIESHGDQLVKEIDTLYILLTTW